MPACSAYGCTQRDRTGGLTFHRFPSEPELRKLWIKAVRREHFIPSKSAFLCSQHFCEDDFDRTSLSCVRLRPDVVPSVFPAFPAHLQVKEARKRKPPKDRVTLIKRPLVSICATTDTQKDQGTQTNYDVSMIDKFQPEELKSSAQLPVHVAGSPAVDSDDTPRKSILKRKLGQAKSSLTSCRKKIKLLQQSKRRLMKRFADLQTVLTEIRKNDILSTESLLILHKCAGGVGDLIQRRNNKLLGKPSTVSYSPQLRSFALTLHFYSPHAYRYVRQMFDTCLPHPRTIEKWFQTINGKPGFTQESLDALKMRAASVNDNGKKLICALMIDEMAIRQQVEWDGKRFQGYIDLGTAIDDDSLPLAKEALTFMVVAINDSFKLPVGYFLIDGFGGTERANMVNQCLVKLHDTGITVVSLTFDGAASNLAMMKCLGCDLHVFSDNFKTCFQSLSEHMLECDPTSNHLVLLLKAIIEEYLKVRYFYAGKQYTAKIREKHRKISRQNNTKLIIFSGL